MRNCSRTSLYSKLISAKCTCWRLPMLFWVSRKVREMAIALFYSSNRFILILEEPLPQTPPPLQNSELYLFLKSLPEGAHQHLRHVTLLFGRAIAGIIALQTWIDCVEMLHRDLDITMLSLTIDFSFPRILMYLSPQDYINSPVDGMTYEQLEKLESDSIRIVCPYFFTRSHHGVKDL